MFEGQYTELVLAVGQIAERIRTLGEPAPGSYREFAALSSIPEDTDRPAAGEMTRRPVLGQEAVVRTARSLFPFGEEANDQPSANLLTQRMQVHEKAAWILRSLLPEPRSHSSGGWPSSPPRSAPSTSRTTSGTGGESRSPSPNATSRVSTATPGPADAAQP